MRAAQGNPFALHRLALDRPTGTDLSDAAALAVADLDPDTRVELARVALAGTPVAVDDVHRDVLVARGLVRLEADGRCRPSHDLIAAAAIDALDDATRRALHAALAATTDDPAAQALHYAAAGDHAGTVAAATRAAERAVTVWARAEALRLVAEHTVPPDPEARRRAADALSLAGRYREALDLLGDDASRRADDAVIRARAHWATTEIDAARVAIEDGLGDEGADPGIATELLSLRSRIKCRVDWDLPGAIEDGERAVARAASGDRLQARERAQRVRARVPHGRRPRVAAGAGGSGAARDRRTRRAQRGDGLRHDVLRASAVGRSGSGARHSPPR